ncbi:molybdenum cofactor guanylyltransferase [Planctomycetota bacterium]|nr:molybdenum cofactor guanylyltransferase [Planctomycetota bacterium]
MLCGGESSRMGQDKAFLLAPDGRALVQVALDALRGAGCHPVRLSARATEPFAHLDAEVVLDGWVDQGPIAGLEAALAATTTEWCLVVACDMPRLEPEFLRQLAQRALGSDCDAVVPVADGRPQPTHAVYRRTCLKPIRAAVKSGRRSLTRLLESLDVDLVPCSARPSFTNVNTPDELAEL